MLYVNKKVYCKIYYCNNLRFATFNKQAIKYSRVQKTDQLKKNCFDRSCCKYYLPAISSK